MANALAVQTVVALAQGRSNAGRSSTWSNQELAEFYRVGDILRRIGWDVEIDRGTTDEDEPWLVYCDASTGDVIMHFAKIDDGYVIDAPALEAPLRGNNFPTLLQRLIAVYASADQVQSIRRIGSVAYAHPVATLAALVAAMCALSDMACRDNASDDSERQTSTGAAVEANDATGDVVAVPVTPARIWDRASIERSWERSASRSEQRHDANTAAKFGAIVVDLVVTVIAFASGSLSMDLLDTVGSTDSPSQTAVLIADGIGSKAEYIASAAEMLAWQPLSLDAQADARTDGDVHLHRLIGAEMATGVGLAKGERTGTELIHLPLKFDFSNGSGDVYQRLAAGTAEPPVTFDEAVAATAAERASSPTTTNGLAAPSVTAAAASAVMSAAHVAEPPHDGGLTAAAAPQVAVAQAQPLPAVHATVNFDSMLGSLFRLGDSFSASIGIDVMDVQTLLPMAKPAQSPTATELALASPTHAAGELKSAQVSPNQSAPHVTAPDMTASNLPSATPPPEATTVDTGSGAAAPAVVRAPEEPVARINADSIETLTLGDHAFVMRRGSDHNYDSHNVVDVLKFFLKDSGAFKVLIEGKDYYIVDADAYAGPPQVEMESMQLADGAIMHLIGIGDVFDRMSAHFA